MIDHDYGASRRQGSLISRTICTQQQQGSTAEVKRGRNTAGRPGQSSTLNASSYPPVCRAAPGTVASFLLHYKQGIAQSDHTTRVLLVFGRAGGLA